MDSFKVFLEQADFVELILNEFNTGGVPSIQSGVQTEQKPWSAKKSEIIQMWKNLRPDVPVIIQPMFEDPLSGETSSYGEDGVRISGSWQFISSVMSRLKEILTFENSNTKLRLIFRGVDKDKSTRPDRQSFVFYVNAEYRAGSNPAKKAKPPTITPPQIP